VKGDRARGASGADLEDLNLKAFVRDPVTRFPGSAAKEKVVHGFAGVTDMEWPEGRAFKQVSSFGFDDQGGSVWPVHLQTIQTWGQGPDAPRQSPATISAIKDTHGGDERGIRDSY